VSEDQPDQPPETEAEQGDLAWPEPVAEPPVEDQGHEPVEAEEGG